MRASIDTGCAPISSHESPTASLRGEVFKTVGEGEASLALGRLVEQVSTGVGRVEIVGKNQENVCVLLSKVELDGLEQALSILSGTKGAQEMRAQLDAIAIEAGA